MQDKQVKFGLGIQVKRNNRQTGADIAMDINTTWEVEGKKYENTESFAGFGATIRSLEDKDDKVVGYKMALAEALEQLARKLKRSAWKTIYSRGVKPLSEVELVELYDEICEALDEKEEHKIKAQQLREQYANTPEAIAKRKARQKAKNA